MAYNKVVLDGQTLIDLSEDTVTEDTLGVGKTAHDASGELIHGKMNEGGPTTANTKYDDGLVKKGDGNNDKFWGTDSSGNPEWRSLPIVNNLTSTATNKPLSAAQGKALKDALNNLSNSSDTQNTELAALKTRLNALADSDDLTLDQLSEIVAYIKNNKSLIDSITTSKVNVSDIVNNLTSTATNKPLSAAQGKALKDGMDEHFNVVQPIEKGGTGQTSARNALEALVAGARTDSENYAFNDDDSILWAFTSSGSSNPNHTYKSKFLKIWNYIKSKLPIVSKTENGLVPKLPDETATNKYLRQDGTWAVPPDNNTTYPYYNKAINASFASEFRTQTKGNTSNGNYISNIRSEVPGTNLPQYGAGLAWGSVDTNGYLMVDYLTDNPEAYIGGGNKNTLNWIKRLVFSDEIPSDYVHGRNYGSTFASLTDFWTAANELFKKNGCYIAAMRFKVGNKWFNGENGWHRVIVSAQNLLGSTYGVAGAIISIDDSTTGRTIGYVSNGSSNIPDLSVKWITVATIEELFETGSTQFKFGIDSNGNYGYVKDGADTVTPFLSPINVSTNAKRVSDSYILSFTMPIRDVVKNRIYYVFFVQSGTYVLNPYIAIRVTGQVYDITEMTMLNSFGNLDANIKNLMNVFNNDKLVVCTFVGIETFPPVYIFGATAPYHLEHGLIYDSVTHQAYFI